MSVKKFYVMSVIVIMNVAAQDKPVMVGDPKVDPDNVVYTMPRKVGSFSSSPDVIDPEGAIKDILEEWVGIIEKEGVDPRCAKSFGYPIPNDTNVIIRPASDCKEAIATKFWEFSGDIDDQGYPTGHGILTIDPKRKPDKSKKCLAVQELFESPIEEVEGKFESGILQGKCHLRWSKANLEAEVILTKGVLHGPFKVTAKLEDETVWTYGIAVNSTITQRECWVVTKDQLKSGICEKPFLFSNSSVTVVIGRNPSKSLPNQGSITLAGYVKNDKLVNASDVFLREVYALGHCAREIRSGPFRTTFVYDIHNRERKFKLHKSSDICQDGTTYGRDAASEALRNYFQKLTFDNAIGFDLDKSPVDRKKSRKLISNVELIEENRYEATFNFFGPSSIEFRYFGNKNEDGAFEGYAALLFTPKVTCFRGDCTMPEFSRLAGHFVDGILQGPVSLTHANMRQTYGFVVTDGIVHSLVVGTGLVPIYPFAGKDSYFKMGKQFNFFRSEPTLIARFVNGKAQGKIWRGLIGESRAGTGFLYGYPEKKSMNMSGSGIAYIYPWYESALLGKFDKNVMLDSKYTHIKSTKCENNLMSVEFDDPDGPSFRYDPPSNENISSDPLLQDPYEEENVEVKTSTLPNAGDGLFAKRDMKKGQLVAFYSGTTFNSEQMDIYFREVCQKVINSSNPCDKYSISNHKGGSILIPSPYDSIDHYKATLAWKSNNDFDPDAHTFFHDVEHPRFGLIIGITAQKDIFKGEEIFVDYKYQNPQNSTELGQDHHQWYFDQLKIHQDKMKEKIQTL